MGFDFVSFFFTAHCVELGFAWKSNCTHTHKCKVPRILCSCIYSSVLLTILFIYLAVRSSLPINLGHSDAGTQKSTRGQNACWYHRETSIYIQGEFIPFWIERESFFQATLEWSIGNILICKTKFFSYLWI